MRLPALSVARRAPGLVDLGQRVTRRDLSSGLQVNKEVSDRTWFVGEDDAQPQSIADKSMPVTEEVHHRQLSLLSIVVEELGLFDLLAEVRCGGFDAAFKQFTHERRHFGAVHPPLRASLCISFVYEGEPSATTSQTSTSFQRLMEPSIRRPVAAREHLHPRERHPPRSQSSTGHRLPTKIISYVVWLYQM